MKKLVAAARRDFQPARLPWIIVQIARVFHDQTDPQAWNSIQEQQRLLPERRSVFDTVSIQSICRWEITIHIGCAGFPKPRHPPTSAADRLVYGNKREKRRTAVAKDQPHGIVARGLPWT